MASVKEISEWIVNKMTMEVKAGLRLIQCKECDKFNIGIQIYEQFDWQTIFKAIGFDKTAGEILVSEEALMRIIQMVNPAQKPRKIRLVSDEDLRK